jgi:molybdate transport system permease protein
MISFDLPKAKVRPFLRNMDIILRRKGLAGNRWARAHIVVFSAISIVSFLAVAGTFSGLVVYALNSSHASVFADPEFLFAVRFTLLTTVFATIGASLVALSVAYVLAYYSFPGKKVISTVLGLPMMVPPLVNGIALLILFGPVLGKPLAGLGVPVAFTPVAAVFAMWFIAQPFAIQMFREAFSSADKRYSSLARTLGLTPLECFFRVELPLARRGIVAGIAMTWARTAGEFGATAMVAGITRLKTETLSAAIFLAMSNGDLESALVISVILLCIAASVYVAITVSGDYHGSAASGS